MKTTGEKKKQGKGEKTQLGAQQTRGYGGNRKKICHSKKKKAKERRGTCIEGKVMGSGWVQEENKNRESTTAHAGGKEEKYK